MALRAVDKYSGRYLIYVGESLGGVNATPEFFERLNDEWDCILRQELAPFPRCYERLFLLRRKEAKPSPWWAWLSNFW